MTKKKSTTQDAIDTTRGLLTKEPDPNVRIHRRFLPEALLPSLPDPTGTLLIGAVIDVETTGLDPKADRIVELAILPFVYDATDRIVSVGEPYSGLQDPGRPISREASEINGLADADLKGQSIDWERVKALVEPVRLFVAHGASFDRAFVEAEPAIAFPVRAWACSYNEVDWKKRFPEVTADSLGAVLAGTRREFYDAHRAVVDCQAVLRVLSTPYELPGAVPAEPQAFTDLLRSARITTRRVWARGAPYELKNTLKLERHYRWSEAERTWYLDIRDGEGQTSELVAAEIAWLREHGVQARVTYFDAKDRWSTRV